MNVHTNRWTRWAACVVWLAVFSDTGPASATSDVLSWDKDAGVIWQHPLATIWLDRNKHLSGPMLQVEHAKRWTCALLADPTFSALFEVSHAGEEVYGSLQYRCFGGRYTGFPTSYLGFMTRITPGLSEKTEWVRQELAGSRVPIVRTTKRVGLVEVVEEAFAVAPHLPPSAGDQALDVSPIECMSVLNGIANFVNPSVACDSAFRHVMTNWRRPVHYRFPQSASRSTTAKSAQTDRAAPGRMGQAVRPTGDHRTAH